MPREHSPRESQLLEKFSSKVTLNPVNATFLSIIKDNSNFLMHEPIIYKIENTDSYLVFGDFVSGYDMNKMQEQMKQFEDLRVDEELKPTPCDAGHENCSHEDESVPETEEDDVLEGGDDKVKEEDVLMLIDQFDISKEEATKALVENKNDPVEAVMYLRRKKSN